MLTFGLVNKPKGNENPATEKWRLCWGFHLSSGFSLLFSYTCCMFIFIGDIFFCKFGTIVLFVMYELLDILIACMLGGFL